MGMEVVWIRLFTPYVGPVVYSFGMILIAYLLATFAGSQIYRYWSRRPRLENSLTWISLALLGMLPLLTADPRIPLHLVGRVFIGVMPCAGMMGFLTPMLVDRCGAGDPDRAGRAYAVNIAGCIAGPLLSGFILLPMLGEHMAMAAFSLPWFVLAFRNGRTPRLQSRERALAYAFPALGLAIFLATKDYESQFPVRAVFRDSTATVIARGTGMERRLLVNGMGMTKLTPITKMMAHLTLASLDHPPRRALIICFGMGTTFRSVMSWGIRATAVELVPSVPRLFTYYHSDGAELMSSPLAHVVIDDGRHFLERLSEKFDAIIIDPPPPVQTAGSSLLYSEDFYAVAKQRLRPGGILQQWLPESDDATQSAVAQALNRSFPYVRVFRGIEGWGWHFLARENPIPLRTAAELASRVPPSAVQDMIEWGPGRSADEQFQRLLTHPSSLESLVALSPGTPPLRDDRPINEYFLLRTPLSQLMAME
jgi:spermidine synthase